jgi:hypothetical protein
MSILLNPLSEAEVTAIMDKPGRGAYGQYLDKFLASGMKGANASETFKGVVPGTIYQGLRNAAKKKDISLDTQIAVVNRDDVIVLLNRVLCEAPSDTPEDENDDE